MNGLNTVGLLSSCQSYNRHEQGMKTDAKSDLGGEESDTLVGVKGRVNVSALDNVLVTTHGLKDGVSEDGTGCVIQNQSQILPLEMLNAP